MADKNLFRLSGGLGVDADPNPNQQVMTQGIGFPLRPIDNVPATDTPDIDDIVAKGIFMSWMGNWQEGVIYPKGSQVRDGSFIMLANTNTFDPAAPQPTGDPTVSQPVFVPADNSDVSIIDSGQVYTFTEAGWIKKLLMWVPALPDANIAYRITVLVDVGDGNPLSSVINPVPNAVDEWVLVALLDQIVLVGATVAITLESINAGASTDIDGGWLYQGPTNTGVAPNAQSWTIDNGRSSFRINKFDLDGTDRSTELEGVIPESEILVVETANTALTGVYRVTSVIDAGLYMNYAVVLINETGGGPKAGEVTNIEIDVPIPLATEYSEVTSQWPTNNPSWATVESVLLFNGVDQSVSTSGFGVDIEFQPAEVSADWDIIVAP